MNIIKKSLLEPSQSSIALIARKQTSLFAYQVLMSAEGIPYSIDSDMDIFAGEAMQSLVAIIRIIVHAQNDDNDDVINDFLTVCDKVGKYNISTKDRSAIKRYLELENIGTFTEAIEAMLRYPDVSYTAAGIMALAVEALIKAKTVFTFMKSATEVLHGLDKDYTKRERDAHYKEPQFFRLTEIARKYGSDFLSFTRDIEKARKTSEYYRQQDDIDDRNLSRVHLVTATRSKGHEYDAVIVLDSSSDEWPSPLSDDMEEERRLFYVAVTRAKKYLYFVYPESSQPSRFLLECGIV